MTTPRPRPAAVLGYTGAVPFLASAVLVWLAPEPWPVFAAQAGLTYGAVILSFIGAVHWGLAMAEAGAEESALDRKRLAWSVVPALIAWLSLAMVPSVALLTQMVGFAAVFIAERRLASEGALAEWYLAMRKPLTLLVLLSLASLLVWRNLPALAG